MEVTQNMEKTVTVDGMHCASCAASIETFLTSQDGVEEADVDVDSKQVHLVYTEEADLPTVLKQVEEMGYEVETGD